MLGMQIHVLLLPLLLLLLLLLLLHLLHLLHLQSRWWWWPSVALRECNIWRVPTHTLTNLRAPSAQRDSEWRSIIIARAQWLNDTRARARAVGVCVRAREIGQAKLIGVRASTSRVTTSLIGVSL